MKKQASSIMVFMLLIGMMPFLGNILQVRASITYYVSNSGSDSNPGTTQGSSWQHIQYAVKHAVAGAIIMVAAGTYPEQVVINQSLTLEGAGDSTIIEPGHGNVTQVYTIHGGTWNGFNLASIIIVQNVTTGTVTIRNLQVNGINVNVTGLAYSHCYPVGITYGESSGTVQNVKVVNMNTTSYVDRSYGIWLNAFVNTVSDAIQNCTIEGYYRNGIMTTGDTLTFDINGNVVTGPGLLGPAQLPNGICIADNSGGAVCYNTITNNHYNYINASQYPYLSIGIIGWNEKEGTTIHDNKIHDNDEGIAPTSGDSIYNNQIYNNEWFGIELEEGAADNNIRFNNIVNNGYGIHLLGPGSIWYTGPGDEPGTGNVASFNNITGNTMGGVQNWDTTQTFNAENNWWGSNSGPGPIGPGTGDKVSSNVTYTPWLRICQLTVTSAYDSPNPSGTTSYFSGTSVTASITSPASGPAGTQYVCTSWTGTGDVPSSGTGTEVTFNITQNSTITWNWKTQYSIMFNQTGVSSDFNGIVMTINGTNYNRNGVTFGWDANSVHSFSYASPLAVGLGKQYVWMSTMGLSTAQKGMLTVTGSGTVTGNYETQYQITFD
jgi:hypothetical protein